MLPAGLNVDLTKFPIILVQDMDYLNGDLFAFLRKCQAHTVIDIASSRGTWRMSMRQACRFILDVSDDAYASVMFMKVT
jgi:hypothetical protein